MYFSGQEFCLVFSLRVPPLSNSIPQITCDQIRAQSKACVLQFYIAPFKAGKDWPQEKKGWKQSIVAILWLLFRFRSEVKAKLMFYNAPFKAGKDWPQGAKKERWKQSIVAISWLLFRFTCKTVRTGHERLFTAPEAWTRDDERVGEAFTQCRHLNLASL